MKKKQEKTEQFQIKKENEGEEEQFALFVILRTELDNSKKISKMLYLREELPARLTMEEITTSEYMLPASAARIVAFLATQLTGTISPYPTVRMVM